jgi:hypothetical protein
VKITAQSTGKTLPLLVTVNLQIYFSLSSNHRDVRRFGQNVPYTNNISLNVPQNITLQQINKSVNLSTGNFFCKNFNFTDISYSDAALFLILSHMFGYVDQKLLDRSQKA